MIYYLLETVEAFAYLTRQSIASFSNSNASRVLYSHVQLELYLFRFAPINSNIPIPIHDELSMIYIFDEADRLILYSLFEQDLFEFLEMEMLLIIESSEIDPIE